MSTQMQKSACNKTALSWDKCFILTRSIIYIYNTGTKLVFRHCVSLHGSLCTTLCWVFAIPFICSMRVKAQNILFVSILSSLTSDWNCNPMMNTNNLHHQWKALHPTSFTPAQCVLWFVKIRLRNSELTAGIYINLSLVLFNLFLILTW